MKVLNLSIASVLILSETNAVYIKNKSLYKSDDMDDLIGSIITNKHSEKKEEKFKGPVDTMVQEAYDSAVSDAKADHKCSEHDEQLKAATPLTQEE